MSWWVVLLVVLGVAAGYWRSKIMASYYNPMRVDIEKVFYHKYYLTKVNVMQLDKIDFYEGGKKMDIDPKFIEEFEYLGLNNTDFVLNKMYLKESWGDE